MYREICQTDLIEFHSTVWEKSTKVSTKYILLCCMAIIAIFLENFPQKFSPCTLEMPKLQVQSVYNTYYIVELRIERGILVRFTRSVTWEYMHYNIYIEIPPLGVHLQCIRARNLGTWQQPLPILYRNYSFSSAYEYFNSTRNSVNLETGAVNHRAVDPISRTYIHPPTHLSLVAVLASCSVLGEKQQRASVRDFLMQPTDSMHASLSLLLTLSLYLRVLLMLFGTKPRSP